MSDGKTSWEIELVDDVSSKARKAEGALARLQKSFQRLSSSGLGRAMTGATAKLSSALRLDEKGLARVYERADAMKRKLHEGFAVGSRKAMDFVKTAGLVGGAITAGIAAQIGVMAVKWADFGQRSRVAFGLLAKHGENAEALFQRSTQLAGQLGLDVMETTKVMQKFRALQFTQDQGEALIKMGADMSALGASGEEVQRIFSQLGQIKAKGRLQGEELIVLAENGLSTGLVMEALAKSTGKSMQQVQKDISNGAVNASDALNAIGEAIKTKTGTKDFGQARAKMLTTTMVGALELLKSKFQLTMLKLGDKVGPALAKSFGAVADELSRFLDSPAGVATLNGIAEGVTAAAGFIRDAIPYVKAFIGGLRDGFAQAWPYVSGAIKSLGGLAPAGNWMQIIAKAAVLMGQRIAVALGIAITLGGMAIQMFRGIAAIVGGVQGAVMGAYNAIGSIFFYISDSIANLRARIAADAWGVAADIVNGLSFGLLYGIPKAVMAARKLGSAALVAVKQSLGIASPSKAFEWVGQQSVAGFERGLASNDNSGMQAGVRDGVNALASSPGGGNSGQRNVIHLNVYAQAPQGGTRQDGEQWGQGAGASIRRELAAFFGDIAAEAG